MPEGGCLTIAATVRRVSDGEVNDLPAGSYVRLSVADSGTGMDEAVLGRAIEPFFSTKGVGHGTGLGLSMVHGLIAQLGGAMTIDSKIGLGTCVALWLPEAVERAATTAGEPQPQPARRGSGIALLVDDEPLVRASVGEMLADLGYEVVEAESATDALQKVSQGLAVELVVTDHLMPGMTGSELARSLRELRPAMAVLIISGHAEAEAIAPDLPHLTKPFRQEALAARIARIRGGGAAGEAQSPE
jgi:CheY-like chemotaxis protein